MPRTVLIAFFFTVQILGGHFGMALILLTVTLSKNIQKHPLLLSFFASWALYTTSFCLLLYTGNQFDVEKPLSLCIMQLSMVYGSAISTPMSGLALIFNIWLRTGYLVQRSSMNAVETEIQERPGPWPSSWTTTALVIIPYAVFAFVVLFFILEEGWTPLFVDRTQKTLYCNLRSNRASAIPYLSATIILVGVIFEVLVVLKLLRFRKTPQWSKAKLTSGALVQLFIRIGIFTVYGILSMIVALEFWFENDKDFALPHIIQAFLPTATFLIFGTQKDLLTAWRVIPLWNRLFDKKSTAPSPDLKETLKTPLVRTGVFAGQAVDKPLPKLPRLSRTALVFTGRQPPSSSARVAQNFFHPSPVSGCS